MNRGRLLIVCSIIFLTSLVMIPNLLREYPLGMDPYYYLHHAGDAQPGMPSLFFGIAELPPLPVTFVLTAILLYLFWLIGLECGVFGISPLSSIGITLVLSAPAFLLRSALFEDDLIGVPISLFCLYLYIKAKSNWEKALAVLLLVAASVVAWRGCLLYVGMLVFYELAKRTKKIWLSLPALAFYFRPDNLVGEHSVGFLFVPISLLGATLGLMGWCKSKLFVRVWAVWFLALGILQAKWLWLATFPLVLMLWEYLKDQKKRDTFLVIAIGLGYFMGAMAVMQSAPSAQQMEDVQEISLITYNYTVANSWHFGHWLRWAGANPINDNLHPDRQDWNGTWLLSHEPLEGYKLVKNYSWALLYCAPTNQAALCVAP